VRQACNRRDPQSHWPAQKERMTSLYAVRRSPHVCYESESRERNVCRSPPRRAVSGRTWAGPVPVYQPRSVHQDTGGAANGDVARRTSLVLGRSKAESAGLVFTTESGTAVEPRNVLRAISTAAKALGMSGVWMHTLRHSSATHMLAAAVPRHTASELLGHHFVTVTGDAHGHVANQGARSAVRRLSAAMGWRECVPWLHQWLHGSKEAASDYVRNGL